MRVKLETVNQKAVLSLRGKLDLSTARNLEAGFKEALETSPEAIYLNLSETDYIDSSGIGSIIRCMNKAKKEGITFGCCDPTNDVKNIFKIAKLENYLNLTCMDKI